MQDNYTQKPEVEKLYTVQEIAELCECSCDVVRNVSNRMKIPHEYVTRNGASVSVYPYSSVKIIKAYWEEKKKQYERGQDFINTIQSGETYKIERYVYTDLSPYALHEHSDVTEKKVIKIYAVNKGNGAAWFTTTTGEAIEADTIIKWERLQTQQELEF